MFKSNYTKPCPDISKINSKKTKTSLFFEVLKRRLWDLFKLNALNILFSLPFFILTILVMGFITKPISTTSTVFFQNSASSAAELSESIIWLDFVLRVFFASVFTIFFGLGPSTAGYTFILRNYSQSKHAFILSDFWNNIKTNFLQAVAVWIIDLVIFIAIVTALQYYLAMDGILFFISIIVIAFALVYVMMHFYIYQLLISFSLPVKAVFKNAFIFSGVNLKSNFALLLILALAHIGIPCVLLSLWRNIAGILIFTTVELIFLATILEFMKNFFAFDTIKRFRENIESHQSEVAE